MQIACPLSGWPTGVPLGARKPCGGPRLPRAWWRVGKEWLVRRAVFAFNGGMDERPTPAALPAADASVSMDDLLLAVGQAGDRAAFAQVFAYFAPRVKAYLRRLGVDAGGADELVQEVMLLVWRRADTFDPRQSSASTWIFTIARNKRVDALRREARPEFDPTDPLLLPEAETPADHRIESRESIARMRVALNALPPEQAELLRLAYFDEVPHSTISAERGIPLGTVKSRLRLAMDRLRKVLRETA